MRLTSARNDETNAVVHTLSITNSDLSGMRTLKDHEERAIKHFARENATVEERLMGLQILVRAIEHQ